MFFEDEEAPAQRAESTVCVPQKYPVTYGVYLNDLEAALTKLIPHREERSSCLP